MIILVISFDDIQQNSPPHHRKYCISRLHCIEILHSTIYPNLQHSMDRLTFSSPVIFDIVKNDVFSGVLVVFQLFISSNGNLNISIPKKVSTQHTKISYFLSNAIKQKILFSDCESS